MTYPEAVLTFHYAFHKDPIGEKQRLMRTLSLLARLRTKYYA